MKTVILMFLLSSTGPSSEVRASYVEKDSIEECQQGIVALKQILTEPRFKIHHAGCHQSVAKLSEFEHPGAEDEGDVRERYMHLHRLVDGKLVVREVESEAACQTALSDHDGWCAISTQKLLQN